MHPLVLFPFLCPLALGQDLATFANPLIGTTDDGHVFPGQCFRIQHLNRAYVSQVVGNDDDVFVTCMLNNPRP